MPEKFTIMVVPKATSKIRSFKVSEKAIHITISALILVLVTTGIFTYRYISFHNKARQLVPLRRDYNQQKLQLQTLAQTTTNLKKDIDRLEKFNSKFRVIVGLPQLEENIHQVSGLGGGLEDTFLEFAQRRENEFINRMQKELTELCLKVQKQQDNLQSLSDVVEDKKSLLACTPSIWPTRGWLTSGFGYRNSPFTGQREMHKGLDIATRFNQPVRATADGVVTFAGRKGSLGKVIVIEHGYGYSTRYGHASRLVAKVGSRVKRNQVIAYVGNTGRSTGPHLHYELRINGVSANPFNYLLN